jgi:hypothetical protein
MKYGFGCLATSLEYRLAKWGVVRSKRFPVENYRLALRLATA